MQDFKEWVRSWAPGPVWITARRVAVYFGRLRIWLSVVIEVRGGGPVEAAKLYASAVCASVTALRSLDRWKDPYLIFDTLIVVPGTGRFHCRRGTDDLFHILPSGQRPVREVLEATLKPGDVFIDAGANIGAFTLLGARLVGPEGRVIAVEMMPDTAALLRNHIAINGLGWVEVVEQALSDQSGVELIARVPRLLAGQASIVRDTFRTDDLIEHRVRTTTLDDLAAGLDQIALMKIDVEGAEAKAFLEHFDQMLNLLGFPLAWFCDSSFSGGSADAHAAFARHSPSLSSLH
ncbi:MAG TPA: FkbM family methyltransferase [Thermohalobaculum sp.]|nr:FkbM family methyltransferase [Thermohalobaculum sp.]